MENPTILLVAISCFITGLAIGAYLTFRGMHLKSRQQLEEELKKCQQELAQYQTNVSDHFNQAAFLMGNLTRNFRELHSHFNESSKHFSNTEIFPALTNDSYQAPFIGEKLSTRPPLDYAPKKSAVGTLSEVYGLREESPRQPVIPSDGYTEE